MLYCPGKGHELLFALGVTVVSHNIISLDFSPLRLAKVLIILKKKH